MLITRIILKLIRIMESFVNKHRLKYFVWGSPAKVIRTLK